RGEEFDRPTLLRLEKEMLGQFVTDHPLLAVKDALVLQTDGDMTRLPDLGDGDVVTVGGIIGAVGRKYTRKGDRYALFRLEDPAVSCTEAMLGKLRAALAGAPGRVPVVVRVAHSQGVTPLRLGDGYRVEPTANLLSELRLLVGREAVRIEAAPAAGNGSGNG